MIVSVPVNKARHDKSMCSHHLTSATYKVSDHHPHHEWQSLAAITPHSLHRVATVVVGYIVISQNFGGTITQKSASWVSVTFLEAMQTQSWCQLALKTYRYHYKLFVVSILWYSFLKFYWWGSSTLNLQKVSPRKKEINFKEIPSWCHSPSTWSSNFYTSTASARKFHANTYSIFKRLAKGGIAQMWCTGVVSSYLLTFRERVDRHVWAISNESHELENVVEDDTNILLIIGIVDMKLAR